MTFLRVPGGGSTWAGVQGSGLGGFGLVLFCFCELIFFTL